MPQSVADFVESEESVMRQDGCMARQMPGTLAGLAESCLIPTPSPTYIADLCAKLDTSGIKQPDDLLTTTQEVREKGLSKGERESVRIMTSRVSWHDYWRKAPMDHAAEFYS